MQLLQAICDVQHIFLDQEGRQAAFTHMLEILTNVTDSQYGFIGEVQYEDENTPYLRTIGITEAAWSHQLRAEFRDYAQEGLIIRNLDSIMGATLRTGEWLILNQMPDSSPDTPVQHPPVDSFLGIPLYSQSELVGMVGLANRKSGYPVSSPQILAPLADACGAIVHTWRFNQMMQSLHEELEISHEETKSYLEESRRLSKELQGVREQERAELAKEIHDEIGQLLTFSSSLLKWTLEEDDLKAETRNRLQKVTDQIDRMTQYTRDLCLRLKPASLDELPLHQALSSYIHDSGIQDLLELEFAYDGTFDGIDTTLSFTLFRILQESLNNVIKHAGATIVDVTLTDRDGLITLRIEDNGIGIHAKSLQKTGSLGLRGMRERVEQVHGSLSIEKGAHVGTTVTAVIPKSRGQK